MMDSVAPSLSGPAELPPEAWAAVDDNKSSRAVGEGAEATPVAAGYVETVSLMV